jgi:hypothetical protein
MIKENKPNFNLFSKLTRLFLIVSIMFLLAPQVTLAADAFSRLRNVVSSKPTYEVDKTTQNTLTDYIGNIISVALGLLGSIFVILIVYAGYVWMTASGNTEKVEKAQQTIKAAVLGVIITVAVYAIWWFVFYNIVKT